MSWRVEHGDCLDVLRGLDEASVDAVVTDPPYGIGFMGHEWDQPGEYGATKRPPRQINGGQWNRQGRTGPADRGSVVAGSYDLSPTANRRFQAWCEAWAAECLRVLKPGGHLVAFGGTRTYHRLAAGIEDAGFEVRDTLAWMFGSGFPKSLNLHGEWEGWGTALKPGHEPIVLARKPLAGTVAGNVLAHGTGALNIDGCRIGFRDAADERESKDKNQHAAFGSGPTDNKVYGKFSKDREDYDATGRWPANVVLDPDAAAMLDEQTPVAGASRFFYCAKTSSAERNAGLDGFEIKRPDRDTGHTDGRQWDIPGSHSTPRANVHPTVKPIDLMRWLVRLVTPPGGTVLDPFAGSGTTGCACVLEGFDFVGVEREAEYLAIARARIGWWEQHPQGLDTDDALRAGRARDGVAAAGQLGLLDGEAA